MKIKPLSNQVLLRRIGQKEVARGGIIIPDTAKEKPQEAEVVAVGNGKLDDNGKRVPMTVQAGNRVLIGKYTGQDIKIDDVEHTIVREDEILANITPLVSFRSGPQCTWCLGSWSEGEERMV